MSDPTVTYPRIPRAGASAAERAMIAADNALNVPLIADISEAEAAARGMGDGLRYDRARFKVLEYVDEAINALDEVSRYDDITRELVRRKIGRAQVRAGFQGGGDDEPE